MTHTNTNTIPNASNRALLYESQKREERGAIPRSPRLVPAEADGDSSTNRYTWSIVLATDRRQGEAYPCSNSKVVRYRATPGGCGARNRLAGSLTPSGAPYPPYSGAGFVVSYN
jgi:hypothetical protein